MYVCMYICMYVMRLIFTGLCVCVCVFVCINICIKRLLHQGIYANTHLAHTSQGEEKACYYMGDLNTGVWGLLDESRPEDGVKLTVCMHGCMCLYVQNMGLS